MKRKFVGLMVTIMMVLGLFCTLPVAAASSGPCGVNLAWTLSEGTLTISGTGNMTAYDYEWWVPWRDNCTYITTVIIEDGVTSIGNYAFYGFTGLTSITIPDSVTTIGDYAFYGCTGLTSINIPSSVTTIGDYAFDRCTGLTSITIPDSVTSIGDDVFRYCSNLQYLKTGYLSLHFYNFFGSGASSVPPSLKTVELTSVTSIGSYAFRDCSGLTSIIIPGSVTTIGDYAFRGCTGLTSITIPDSVTTIGDYAFYGCSGLTSIIIPGSVTSIGEAAFSGCTGLTSITIPDSITSVGLDAFPGTISTINYLGEKGDFQKILYNGTSLFVNNLGNATLIFGNTECPTENGTLYMLDNMVVDYKGTDSVLHIPSAINGKAITSIGSYAFKNCTSLTSITIPDSVTSIGDDVFRYCSNLQYLKTGYLSLHFYNFFGSGASSVPPSLKTVELTSVTSIGEAAFRGCTGLTSITIPDSVTTIGDYAFDSCTGLTNITIPDSVTSIGGNAFINCWNLQEVSVPFVGASRTAGGAKDGVFGYLFGKSSTGEYVLANQYYAVTSLVEYHIPTALKKVNITDATKIPYGAFAGCTGLEYISLNEGITDISRLAFSSCDILSVRMPASVSFIGTGAFESTDVKKLYVSLDSYCQDYAETNSYPYELYDYYPVTGVTLTETNVDIVEGDTHTLTPVIAPENATYPSVTWKSSDENVATVSQSGVVTAVSRGTATITATTTEGGFSASCTVNILRSVTSVSLSHSELYIGVGNSKTLTATVYPVGASDKTVTWSSSDTRVATVTNGIVTAVGYGTATITVTTNDGGYTAKCIINSTVPVTSVSLNKTSANLYAGDTLPLIATVLPENAFDKTVTWTSSNEAVASVENGTVTAKSVGTAIITATTVDGERTATCTITVSALTPDTPENEDAPYVSLSSKKATAGSTIEVEVQIANNPGFVALGLEIEYDSTYLTLTGVKAENGVGATFTPAQSYGKIPFNFGWSSTDNVYYNGKLATLTFTVSENAPDGVYPISLSHYKGVSGNYKDGVDTNYDEDFQALGLAYVSANIAVISYTPGDINGDNTVNDRDATFLLRYLAGWTQDGIIEAALDTDGSGTVNDRDATLLLRYLASWDVELH